MRPKNALFPQRRDEDRPRSAFGLNIISLTDLIGVILTFFILLYSTRDPSPPMQNQTGVNGVSPIVSQQNDPKVEGALTKILPGLDLNYVAALLRQAQIRDPRLSEIAIETKPYALVMNMDKESREDVAYALDKLSIYRRTIAVFAPQPVIAALIKDDALDGSIRYYPQSAGVRILIH